MKSQFPSLIFGFLVVFSTAKAQMKSDSLNAQSIDEIIITGTKTKRAMTSLPMPVQLITRDQILQSGSSRLNEILQEQTGLITVPDFGGGEGLQMQGLDAAYTMILIDGQPLFGRSAGTLDLSRITVNNIERIEIIKGASSCLYGSEALAGVINIITQDPKSTNKIQGKLNYKLASFYTHDLSTVLEYGKENFKIELFGNYFATKGYNLSDNSYLQTVEPYQNFTIQPKLKLKLSENWKLSTSTRIFGQNQDYKSEVDGEKLLGKSKINEWNQSFIINQKWGEHVKLDYDFYITRYQSHEFLNHSDGRLFEENNFNQLFFRPEIRSAISFNKNLLSLGLGMNLESLDRTYFDDKINLNTKYLYGQFEWFLSKKWNFLGGFRLDHFQNQTQFSPKVGFNYQWNENFSLKATVGAGYKVPDLRQLYFDFTNSAIGYTILGYNVAEEKLKILENQGQLLSLVPIDFSSPLKPEQSMNYNFGMLYKKNRWTLDANFFYNDIKNLIDTKVVAQRTNGQNVFSYFNINKIITYGTELNLGYKFSSNLKLSLGYQYLIAKDKSVMDALEQGEIYTRDPETLESFKLKKKEYFGLYNRSKHTANVKVEYRIPALKTAINARVFYRSKYGLLDTNGNDILDRYDDFVKAYTITNISVSKDFIHGFQLQAGVVNLFDYTDKNNISNLPGRQLFGRINFQF